VRSDRGARLRRQALLGHVEDLASRRILGIAPSEHHDATVAVAALEMAAAVRGGVVAGVIFHSDRGREKVDVGEGPRSALMRILLRRCAPTPDVVRRPRRLLREGGG
jgi:transposase InsO family protein